MPHLIDGAESDNNELVPLARELDIEQTKRRIQAFTAAELDEIRILAWIVIRGFMREAFINVLDRRRSLTDNGGMSSDEITGYLDTLDEPKRSTLQKLRETILSVIPEAEEGISYLLPAFRVRGKVIAGFAAFKNHLSYLPHSGAVFPELQEDLAAYPKSTGALRFPVDQPLPKEIVEKLIKVRIEQAFAE